MSESFNSDFQKYFSNFLPILSTEKGDWTVKGFIDIYKNIYTISIDTKVISKIIELMIFPKILDFCTEYDYQLVLCDYQNHYPDITFIDNKTGEKIALDIKSTYRLTDEKVNGMTLGAFTGYFRSRESSKNIRFPYKDYSKHYVLGVIYSRTDIVAATNKLKELGHTLNNSQRDNLSTYLACLADDVFEIFTDSLRISDDDKKKKLRIELNECVIDERQKFRIQDLETIKSVVRDFDFFLQEKWQIAIDRPGSGNTKNIGSTNLIKELKEGKGLFTKYAHGYEYFNDYWMNYLTKDMARTVGYENPPYKNLETYFKWRKLSESK